MTEWIAQSFPFFPCDFVSFWQHLHPNPKYGFILGAGKELEKNHRVFLSLDEPVRLLTIQDIEKISFQKKGMPVPSLIGVLGFEASRDFDAGFMRIRKKKDPLQFPASLFGRYADVVELDAIKKRTRLWVDPAASSGGFKRAVYRTCQAYNRSMREIKKPHKSTNLPRSKASQRSFQFPSQNEYADLIRRAKHHIREGDVYQANLSIRFQSRFRGRATDLYRLLCEKNPSPYSCLMKLGDNWIVSCSPELLMSVRRSLASTRPIAGTRPRGRTKSSDKNKKGQLLLSPKERAEHLMLVDLERNDLGRVCRNGTVRVRDAYAIERYSHVMHIVSAVEGTLKRRTNAVAALKSLFPGGTITGCPKIRSTELISHLEPVARGPFYGSAGFFCDNGDAMFNILIRTALIQKNHVYVQAGAGIVADSHPKREFKEVLSKAQVLLESINRINGVSS